MTESVPEVVAAPLPADAGAAHAGAALAGAASESATATTPEGAAAADRAGNAAGRAARNRGRRGGKDRGGRNAEGAPAAAQAPAPQRVHPALEQLAGLYPHLFGAVFRPLKRGIFQDLLAAHPELFEREALKVALGIHTRSTRYLQTVAAGEQRHDLQGQPVEAMAPEHVHHALLEVYRRRKNQKGRPTEDLLPKLRNRMIAAFEASGLTREAYTELVVGRDDAANAILEEAFAEWAARNAKAEALLRAFEASGSTLEQFADMYGMDPRSTGQQLERARKLAAAKAAPQADGGAAD
ncbi:ProQ/FINO family protein [Acidovorax sp. 56]|uniref:ProQ/FINO family protein n=1 Tax=Acidovorax sp. 56 TaxID=2035205 RepID=UPI000C172630|nr:ProQ/FINO family protein [Acidovorax sp. 56]PIF28375.1 ProQ/FINO family protein [Acidovorax sp. 56]